MNRRELIKTGVGALSSVAVLGTRPVVQFPEPDGVERARIDPKTGLRAYEGMQDALEEVFVAGTAPKETALPPDMLDSSKFMIDQLGGLGPQVPQKTPPN